MSRKARLKALNLRMKCHRAIGNYEEALRDSEAAMAMSDIDKI